MLTDEPDVAFKDANWCLLVGSKPRGPGMERADLLKDNGRIFIGQGQAIDEVAGPDVRVAVVGNPCNTNCMIAAANADGSPGRALHRDDAPRPEPGGTQLAQKAGVPVTEVTDLVIYGNHSPTMFADFAHAKIGGRPADRGHHRQGLAAGDVPARRGQARRGDHRGPRASSSAASAANALVDHVRSLITPSDKIHSVAVVSDGSYGFAEGVWASVPVRTTAPGDWERVTGIEHDDFAREKLAATNAELVSERETVAGML